ncbi:MAG: hypothetical protein QOF02_2427 [Blastocatellia bacterium]|jgi:hypothetical protein|nr:hypothetical protein [Blastocatellia bacterium]
MSNSLDETLRSLNDCGCCEGISGETPAGVENRPGLSAIAYRVGTQATFKETMLARLSGSGQAALRGLGTRTNDDFTIALVDAWAVVADVLTFYQERIANESYLRTATERLSVLELANLIGYKLRPGVAASAYLAFNIEDAPGAFGQAISFGASAQIIVEPPPPVIIDVGTKVQSVPGPGEKAQIFETTEKIEAFARWNAIAPRLTQPQTLDVNMGSVMLQGTATNLKKGDTLLVIESAASLRPKTILQVTADDDANLTRVDFDAPALSPPVYRRPTNLPKGSVTEFPTKVELNEAAVQKIIARSWSAEDLSALIKIQNWSSDALALNLAEQTSRRSLAPGSGVFTFRQRAAIFGYNAPVWDSLPASMRFSQLVADYDTTSHYDLKRVVAAYPTSWENRTLEQDANASGNQRTVDLDATYQGIAKESWLLLSTAMPQGGAFLMPFKIKSQRDTARSGYSLSAKVTRLSVESPQQFSSDFKIRTTTALVQSEPLTLADVPILELSERNDGARDSLTLDRAYLGLKKGQKVILTGERADLRGEIVSETRELKEVLLEGGFTVLVFDKSLAYNFVRSTLQINANVAAATHGESVAEVLGSGDGSKAFQSFTLRQPPLTYVSANTPSGAESTLEIRVDDLLWHEVPTFYGRGPDERIYVTRNDDDGTTTVMFGDGLTGARLPTGQENVRAKYRRGIGAEGLVKAHQLSQLMTRPLGVRGASNPLAAVGAADPENLKDARRNAPLTVLTLDRVVSLADYENFARSFSGIEKALATWVLTNEQRVIHLTIAGANGASVEPDSKLYKNLLKSLRQFGDALVPLTIESYEPRLFRLSAALKIDPDFLPEKVLAEVETTLRAQFSFEARDFIQHVNLSEVIAIMQRVAGVVAVNVKEFYGAEDAPARKPRLEAKAPRAGGDSVFPAQILTLDPRPLNLEVMP